MTDGGHVHVVGELTLDFRTYRRLALSVFGGKYGIFQVLMGAFLTLTVVLLALGFSTMSPFLLVGCVFGMVVYEVAVLIGWRRTAKLTTQPWRYVVTNSDVGIHTPYTDVTTRWDGVASVRTRRHVWALRLANKKLVPIPRAAFMPADAARVDALVAAIGAGSR